MDKGLSAVPRLMWMTHTERFPAIDPVIVGERAMEAGLPVVLLREKKLPAGLQYEMARRFKRSAGILGKQFGIVDRLDIFSMLSLDVIHLPAESLPVTEVIRHKGEKGLVGQSVHDLDGAQAAEIMGADFIIAGSVFPTESHPGAKPLGLDGLRGICSGVKLPVLAIGGITPENVGEIEACGAYGVVVVGCIYESDDLPATISALLAPWK